jgi:hypothetical protein
MHASMRRYDAAPEGFARAIEAEFLPRLRRAPGFVAYYVIDGGGGEVTTVSVFSTAAFAEDSDALARAWLAERGAPEPAEIRAGLLAVAAPAIRG